jgi:hypothetical protein
MIISEEEIYKDYMYFVKQEAIKANCKWWEIIKIIRNKKD